MEISKNEKDLRRAWVKSKANFSKDQLTIRGFQVMQRWESAYMKKLAEIAARNGGKILEIGYGMGMSAEYIQKTKSVKQHVIIECHPDVVSRATKKYREKVALGKVILLTGFWQDIVPFIKSDYFDGILFDDIEIDKEPHFFQSFAFFKHAYRLLKKGGIFAYFSDEPSSISENHQVELKKAGFMNISYEICNVKPPKDCKYWKHNTIIAPIVRK